MLQVQMRSDICSTAFVGVMEKSESDVSNQATKRKETVRHIDQNTIDYFKNLIRKYKKKMGDSEVNEVCSGGLQQYLNKFHESDVHVPESKNPQRFIEGQCHFCDIPVVLKLHIFSYLRARDLCQVSRVCKEWYELTQDNLLWQQLLRKDVRKWDVIGHNTYPGLYKEVQSEWTNKDIYLRCSPEVTELMIQRNAVFHNISSLLRYFLPKKVPMLAMFGPGLESSTSCIVRRMMYEENNCFQKIGLFPGQFDGVGAGMTVRINNTGRDLNLSVLYSATKKEREGSRHDRMQHNKLVRHNAQEEEGKEKYNLLPAIRDLCRTLDGFVFVVDASQETVYSGLDELEAMISERWSSTHVPVLVLSCVREEKDPRIPCIQVVEQLKLTQLNKPWQVRNCVADTLTGVPEALTWLVEQSQRR
ncbi:hypothetical protein CHS0354_019300 [Potamilus streckersoni]|uniref:F-box domain-containing protein n=1 Tax=Potamilus streckersoni TaxID=2493646 RepID=A0AAE0SIF7_9BIVA|nr:hypothetical protein CHS0354_019300 [Potamilus streckersoni]